MKRKPSNVALFFAAVVQAGDLFSLFDLLRSLRIDGHVTTRNPNLALVDADNNDACDWLLLLGGVIMALFMPSSRNGVNPRLGWLGQATVVPRHHSLLGNIVELNVEYP